MFELVNAKVRLVTLQLTSAELSSILTGEYSLICDNHMMTTISISPVGAADSGLASVEMQGCDKALRTGQHVGVNLVRLNSAAIPGDGIFEDAEGKFVYVVHQGKVHRQSYEHLSRGDKVIVLGTERIAIGDDVTVIDVSSGS